ncbi:hypothetical protein, partial [Xylella fastidiosa]|uniref:hypothetical protein n=1 Tax=Xylella fastidiosa TaxID=2371 RepID=UPI001EEA11D4
MIPSGNELNCEADAACLTRSIKYSARKVVPVGDDECPQDYEYADPPVRFAPRCSPLYHLRDLDVPVYPEPPPRSRWPRPSRPPPGATA